MRSPPPSSGGPLARPAEHLGVGGVPDDGVVAVPEVADHVGHTVGEVEADDVSAVRGEPAGDGLAQPLSCARDHHAGRLRPGLSGRSRGFADGGHGRLPIGPTGAEIGAASRGCGDRNTEK